MKTLASLLTDLCPPMVVVVVVVVVVVAVAVAVAVVVYSFSMHKKRHTMTSVKAVQRETTVYAYCG